MSNEQLTLDINLEKSDDKREFLVDEFSADGFAGDIERKKLEMKYAPLLEITDKFSRKSVSFQLSKKDALHSWLKYKEGFSAELVDMLLNEMDAKQGDLVMDPFMGSGTTALVCQMKGINSIGYDIMPISEVSINAKSNVLKYNTEEIAMLIEEVKSISVPQGFTRRTPYITITDTAYPEETELFLQYISEWNEASKYSLEVKNLVTLCVINSLERISYTTKSGQYLKWDSRSKKVIETNKKRLETGKPLLKENYVRQTILGAKDTIISELEHVYNDIRIIQKASIQKVDASIDYKQSSALYELPKLSDGILKGVITSPPYCNRYDYTRTYALELVYLGSSDQEVKKMRQDLLSCTVESKSKIDSLAEHYNFLGQEERFQDIYTKIKSNKAFVEIMTALYARKDNNELNNAGILRMVEGYFTELAFIYAELYRVCQKGAMVVFVNDNVRYGGEVIPVDFLSCSFAEQFGFKVKKIYTLKQKKGNSSQQMAKYGRIALRKSVTVWLKE